MSPLYEHEALTCTQKEEFNENRKAKSLLKSKVTSLQSERLLKSGEQIEILKQEYQKNSQWSKQ